MKNQILLLGLLCFYGNTCGASGEPETDYLVDKAIYELKLKLSNKTIAQEYFRIETGKDTTYIRGFIEAKGGITLKTPIIFHLNYANIPIVNDFIKFDKTKITNSEYLIIFYNRYLDKLGVLLDNKLEIIAISTETKCQLTYLAPAFQFSDVAFKEYENIPQYIPRYFEIYLFKDLTFRNEFIFERKVTVNRGYNWQKFYDKSKLFERKKEIFKTQIIEANVLQLRN